MEGSQGQEADLGHRGHGSRTGWGGQGNPPRTSPGSHQNTGWNRDMKYEYVFLLDLFKSQGFCVNFAVSSYVQKLLQIVL